MKNAFRKLLLLALLPTLVVAHGAERIDTAVAQEASTAGMKTIAVLSLTSYDELLKNLDFIGELAGQPGSAQQAEMMINLFTQGQGLAGLDKSKPSGVLVQTDGMSIVPLAFIPVSEAKPLLDVLAAFDITSEEGENGVYTVQAGPQELFVKSQGSWAFIAHTVEALAAAPENPQQLLAGLDKEYDVALRLNVQNLPAMFSQRAIQALKGGVAEGLQQMPGEAAADYETRQKVVQAAMSDIEDAIRDTDQVTLGWSLNTEQKTTHLDCQLVAVEGSKLAKQFAESAAVKTSFGGFVSPEGAFTMTMAGKMTDKYIVRAVTMLGDLRRKMMERIDEEADLPDDAARETVKAAMGDLLDAAKATIEGGILDVGCSLQLGSQSLTLSGGARIASSDRVEQAVRKLAELAETEEDFPGVQWNADSHGDVQFHTLQIPAPNDDARKVFGDQLNVVLGIGPDSVYFAIGTDVLKAIKDAMDRSNSGAGEDLPPVAVEVSLSQIMRFAAAHDTDPQVALLAGIFSDLEGKDHISITARAIKNGFQYRMEVEEGVLAAIGKAGAMMSGVGGQNGF